VGAGSLATLPQPRRPAAAAGLGACRADPPLPPALGRPRASLAVLCKEADVVRVWGATCSQSS
jgi:hypothetical protein